MARTFNWDLRAYRESVMRRLTPIIDEVRGRGLTRELIEVIEDPDVIHEEPTARLIELGDLLTRNNLIIYEWTEAIGGVRVPKNTELGIGEYYAWQLPIYRVVARQVLN